MAEGKCLEASKLSGYDWVTDITSYKFCLEGFLRDLLLGAGLLSIPDQSSCALLNWALNPSKDRGHLFSDLSQGCTTLCRRNFS